MTATCLSTLGNGRPLEATGCGHLFHEECIRECIRHRQKYPNCPKAPVVVIKVFTTIDLASESEANTEEVESSQAYLEVKQENAVLKQQLDASEANRKRDQEETDIRELAHEHYQIELFDRARQWQENFLHVQVETTRLQGIEVKFEKERKEKAEITKRHEKRGNRIDKLTTRQAKIRKAIQAQVERSNPGSWSQNKVSIRNYDPEVAENPERASHSSYTDLLPNHSLCSITSVSRQVPSDSGI